MDTQRPIYRFGTLAKLAGVHRNTAKKLERLGLVDIPRDSNGHRYGTAETVQLLQHAMTRRIAERAKQ